MKSIAVLTTCFNRRQKTITCLTSLYKAAASAACAIKLDIYLVDDGSNDGTAEAVSVSFPDVNIIQGDGSLFWAGGMRRAWTTALAAKVNYDSFLLLNDDVKLADDVFNILIGTHRFCLERFNCPGIYVCSTADPESGKISYGGRLLNGNFIFVRKTLITPSGEPLPCSMANCNILMVSANIVEKIGILDGGYIHKFADYDYTLCASKIGIPVLVCPGIGGVCRNDSPRGWLTSKTALSARIKYLYSPVGLGYGDRLHYLRRHFKVQLPYYFIMLWVRTLFPVVYDMFKRGQTGTPFDIG